MASTRYIVTATANYGDKIMSNLKSAKREADLRAKGDRMECLVLTVATGRIAHRAEGPAPVLPAPVAAAEFDILLGEVKAEAEAAKAPVAAKAPRKTARREGLGDAVVAGWELLYDKPRQSAQVGRKDGQYALLCTEHHTVHLVAKLVDERAARKAGGWCASCAH